MIFAFWGCDREHLSFAFNSASLRARVLYDTRALKLAL